MKRNMVLTIVSLLSLLLMTFHMTHDTVRQAEGAVKYPIPVFIFGLWLYGTLMLSDRVWGNVIMFIGGLIAAGMIVVHSPGLVVRNSGGFFFVWTLFALATTGWVTMILSARELWATVRARRGAKRTSAAGPSAPRR